jgi:hypothetical protein
MPPSPPLGHRVGPGGLLTAAARVPRLDRRLRFAEGLGERRDLEIVAAVVVGASAMLAGQLVWLAAILLLGAMLFGTLQILADVDAPDAERGVPIESLILPSVAAIGCLGAIRLVPLGLGTILALIVTWFLVDRAVFQETRLLTAEQGPTADDRASTLVATLLIAFVAFCGAAAIVPGGIAGLAAPGAPTPPLAIADLATLVLADALIAGLLGYRAAALRVTSARHALWSAATYAIAIAIAAAAIRALGIPRLVGPALLMFVFYLWDAFHGTPSSRRRDPRWIWETLALAGLGILVVAWNLRLSS